MKQFKNLILFLSLTLVFGNSQAQTITNTIVPQSEGWIWGRQALCHSVEGRCVATDKKGNAYVAGFYTCNEMRIGNAYVLSCSAANRDIYLVKFNSAGSVIWSKSIHGWGRDEPTGMAVDDMGNVYLSGFFDGLKLFWDYTVSNNPGTRNQYVVKYDYNGNFMWAREAGGLLNVTPLSLCPDGKGGVCLAGHYTANTLIVGAFILTNDSSTTNDMYIAHFNENGVVTWAKSYGGYGDEKINSITSDATGDLWITGSYNSASLAMGTYTLNNAAANTQMFLARLDSTGNINWAQSIGNAAGSTEGTAIVTDNSGNYFVSGNYTGTALTLGNTVFQNNDVSGASADIFYAAYNGNGVLQWAKSFGSNGKDISTSMCSNGVNYLAGSFSGNNLVAGAQTLTNTQNGTSDLFFIRFDLLGNILLASSEGTGANEAITSIAAESSGNVFVTGYLNRGAQLFSPNGSIVFGKDTLNEYYGYEDAFTAKWGTVAVKTPTTGSSVGIDEQKNDFSLAQVYPNPFQNSINIRMNGNTTTAEIKLQVTDVVGRLCLQKDNVVSDEVFNLSNCPAGIYFLTISNGNQKQTIKILKE